MKKSKIRLLTTTLLCTLALSSSSIPCINQPTAVYAAESSVETATISEILANQQADGGWRKNYKTTSGEWSKSTIDNNATYTEIRKLAAEYKKTNDKKYSNAVLKGINFLITMQYDNGGWPQNYKGTGYHAAITYNDNAMVNVLYLLDEVSNKKGDFAFVDDALAKKAKTSVEKGVQCILDTQVVSKGKLTAWGQQHDKNTLKPTSARAYELPSICSSESADIVKFLKTRKATPEINKAISAAVTWFKDSKITGIDVVKANGDTVVKENPNSTKVYWARFYEIDTNKPMFCGRDGVVKYKLSDIEKERRSGYAWYGSWGSTIVNITVSGNTSSSDSNKDENNNTNNNTGNNNSSSSQTASEAHNFTKDKLNSSFFTITGNLSSDKGTVKYNGLTLKDCLKMESSTNISFKTTKESNLTLVFNSDFNKKVTIDGKTYTAKDGILTVSLKSGSHTIAKKDSCNLYYIGLANK